MQFSSAIRKSLLSAIIAASSALVVVSVMPSSAIAAAKSEISSKVGKPLQEAQDLAKAKKFKEALAKVKEVDAMPGKNPQEESITNDLLSFIYAQSGDQAGLAAHYENLLAKNQVKPERLGETLKTLAQVYAGLKNYPKFVQYAERYQKDIGFDPEIQRQIVGTYYLQKDYAKSADLSQKYIKSTIAAGKTPTVEWFKLWTASLFSLNKLSELADAQELQLSYYPTDENWTSLFNAAQKEGSFNDRQNIILLRLRAATGLASAANLTEFAELSLASANPGDAKAALEQGFAKGLLGTGAAKDRENKLLARAKSDAATDLTSLASIEKEAANKPNGEALVKIGEGYIGHGQYENAIAAISKGLAKGGVSFKDEATINLGIAYLGAKKQAEAIKAFKSVPASSKVARLARLWAIHAAKTK